MKKAFIILSLLATLTMITPSFFLKQIEAAHEEECVAIIPDEQRITVPVDFLGMVKGFKVEFYTLGTTLLLECSDDGHPLEGKTNEMVLLTDLRFIETRDEGIGVIRGFFEATFHVDGVQRPIEFRGIITGDGVCDESGACELDLIMNGRTKNGASVEISGTAVIDQQSDWIGPWEVILRH